MDIGESHKIGEGKEKKSYTREAYSSITQPSLIFPWEMKFGSWVYLEATKTREQTRLQDTPPVSKALQMRQVEIV